MKSDLTILARASGYLDAFLSRVSRRVDFAGFTGDRSAYDAGFQDGQVMRAVRSGEIPAIRPSWPGPAKPRQMLAGDLVAIGDPEYRVLQEMEMRRMKESAYYFLQYALAVEGLNFSVPGYVLEVLKETEKQASRADETARVQARFSRSGNFPDFYADLAREILDPKKQVEVITGIDHASLPDETAVRRVGKSALLGMGYGESAREGHLRLSRLAEALQEPKGCAWCGALPIRDNLDGDNLCQDCCGKWAEGERS